MAEHQVGRPAGQDRQPVGEQPVGQGGHERRAAGHASEDEQAGQAGFYDAEAARCEGDEGHDAGRRVCQQGKRRLRVGAGCAQGTEQTAEIKADPACGEQQRLAPLAP